MLQKYSSLSQYLFCSANFSFLSSCNQKNSCHLYLVSGRKEFFQLALEKRIYWAQGSFNQLQFFKWLLEKNCHLYILKYRSNGSCQCKRVPLHHNSLVITLEFLHQYKWYQLGLVPTSLYSFPLRIQNKIMKNVMEQLHQKFYGRKQTEPGWRNSMLKYKKNYFIQYRSKCLCKLKSSNQKKSYKSAF